MGFGLKYFDPLINALILGLRREVRIQIQLASSLEIVLPDRLCLILQMSLLGK